MKKHQVTKTEPYSYGLFYSKPYSIQNMLIYQYQFPYEYYEDDYVDSVYSDRIPHDKYEKAIKKYLKDKTTWSWDTPDENHKISLAFFSEIFGRKITGYRIVRYTNVSSGYPVWRFDVFAKSKKTPNTELYSGQHGENVEYPKENIRYMDGRYVDGLLV